MVTSILWLGLTGSCLARLFTTRFAGEITGRMIWAPCKTIEAHVRITKSVARQPRLDSRARPLHIHPLSTTFCGALSSACRRSRSRTSLQTFCIYNVCQKTSQWKVSEGSHSRFRVQTTNLNKVLQSSLGAWSCVSLGVGTMTRMLPAGCSRVGQRMQGVTCVMGTLIGTSEGAPTVTARVSMRPGSPWQGS
jgi:hypothetical protein